MNVARVRKLLRAACAGDQGAWARRNGVSAQYVSDVLHGRREPGNAILAALRLRRVVTYVPIGVSEGAQRMVERMGCAFVPRLPHGAGD